ncbi:MAG: sugar ABC transporter permease [Clostridiales bacterium]|nr:MAG: sugar ABC transporter permease [Clostridiales bacterium]
MSLAPRIRVAAERIFRQKETENGRLAGKKRDFVPYIFLAPSFVLVTVFILIPFIDVVRRSFFSAMSNQFVGLKNYIVLFQNDAFRLAGWNTIKFTLVCIPILLIFSLLLALAVSAFKEQRGVFKTSFLLPMAIPVASIVLLWKAVFEKQGLLNAVLEWAGLAPIDWIYSEFAFFVLVFTYLWKNVGYDMVLWLSGISGIPPALYESAQIDGAGAVQRFFRITLPNLMPTVFTTAVLSLLNSFKVFREAYLIAGAYPDKSIYMLQHLFNNWFASLDIDKMCAGAVVMALVVFAVILLLQRLLGREESQ